MATLIFKNKGGREYAYWVRSGRVNGKPRIVEQVYLGPRDRVLERIKAVFTAQETAQRQPLKQVNHKYLVIAALAADNTRCNGITRCFEYAAGMGNTSVDFTRSAVGDGLEAKYFIESTQKHLRAGTGIEPPLHHPPR